MIASIVLPVLFVTSGLFALATLVIAWRGHAGELRALRRQLTASEEYREFAVRLALTETREYLPVARRNAVRARPAPSSVRPQPRPARHVAA